MTTSENMHEQASLQIGRLNLHGAIDAVNRLTNLPICTRLVIDFTSMSTVEPFGMMYFGRHLHRYLKDRPKLQCTSTGHENHGYASHMGLFRACGFDSTDVLKTETGTDRYIPITRQTLRDLHVEAGSAALDVHEIIERRAGDMARILSRGEAGNVEGTLKFSIREVIRNVVEHSNADHIWYAAQYWPTRQMVELSILDEGIGVRSALSRNPYLELKSDAEALSLALQPGVSGVAYEGRPPNRNNEWANSGYGLFMMSELCAKGGSFTMSSGSATITRDGAEEKNLRAGFPGTVLRLNLYTPALENLDSILSEANKKGEEIAGGRHMAIKSASQSSSRLAHGFGKSD